jgi:hypothetical protein
VVAEEDQDVDGQDGPQPVRELHLRNVHFMFGSGVTRGSGTLWRVRIRQVSGWMVGSVDSD